MRLGETSVDLQKHHIKDTAERSRKTHEDQPEGMCKEVDYRTGGDNGRDETFHATFSLTTLLRIQYIYIIIQY